MVGSVSDGSRDHAAEWVDGELRLIDPPGVDAATYANALDSAGVVVGGTSAPDGDQSKETAFVDVNGTATPLDALVPASSGLHVYAADDVNDLGQILAQATYKAADELVVLTPPPIADLVATPTAEVAAVVAGRGLFARRRRT